MYDIEVRHPGNGSVEIELRGEFDLTSENELRETLSRVASLRRPTTIDLSWVTFMDLQSTRELAVRSQIYAHHITLINPSWQVKRSVRACKLGKWVRFERRVEQPLEKVS